MNEDRYESLEIIVKARDDGQSWFDIIADLISANCTDPEVCTCGLESMGGTTGTLDQCFRNQGIADDLVGPVKKDDLLLVLDFFARSSALKTLDEYEAAKRLRHEATWWDEVLASHEEEDEEDELYPDEIPIKAPRPVNIDYWDEGSDDEEGN